MTGSASRFLIVRTFKSLKGGGPVPPLGALYLVSAIRARFGGRFVVRVLDSGVTPAEQCLNEMRAWAPDFVGLSSLSCEDDLLHTFARAAKEQRADTVVIAGGPHATILRERLFEDPSVDYSVIGEGERTLVELLNFLTQGGEPGSIAGLAFRTPLGPAANRDRAPVEDLDTIPFPAWDLINLDAYAREATWAGALRESRYAPIVASRGCPYGCTFCHNVFGKTVHRRSAQNIVDEVTILHRDHGVREIHFLDDIFNADTGAAAAIARRLIESGMRLSIAFPNGLRADLMTDELLSLLKEAGTYKINYGVETVSPRLQEAIGKRLDIPRARAMIDRTSRAGIITGGYFMLGFPTQTSQEIMQTIDYAAESRLDVAYFFKATPYPGSALHNAVTGDAGGTAGNNFTDLHFYAANLSVGAMDSPALNRLVLLAQRRFYLNARRLWRGFMKAPRKAAYIRNLLTLFAVLLQARLFEALTRDMRKSGP